MTLAVFVLALLASCRLTRLITEDVITAFFRDFLTRRVVSAGERVDANVDSRLSALAYDFWVKAEEWSNCPWCAGFWVASAVTAVMAAAVHSHGAWWFTYPATALSISYLIGVIATVVYTVEEL